jgi:GT2 family glycosyltransferase
MHRLTRLFRKELGIYRKEGWTGLSGLISWLLQLFTEKLLLSIEARAPCWWPGSKFKNYSLSDHVTLKSQSGTGEPVVTVILPMDGSDHLVRSTIRSLVNQANPNWECILCCPDDTRVNPWKTDFRDDRVKVIAAQSMTQPEALVSQVNAQVLGKWFIIARPGDKYSSSLVDLISDGKSDILYWDEALYKGFFIYSPFLKPDWSPELWLSVDLLRCAAFKKTDLFPFNKQINTGFTSERVARAKTFYHIPAILTLCKRAAWKDPFEVRQHVATVNEYLKITNAGKPQVEILENKRISLLAFDCPELVSIIIPTKDNLSVTRRCLNSIYETRAGAEFEIILVDDQSEEPATLDYYRQIQREHKNLRIIRAGQKFNYSRSCNLGAHAAKGKFLLFLNNDVEVKTVNWLGKLLTLASIEGVGVVGAKLLYPGGKIQHAGIVLGLEGHASHVFNGHKGRFSTLFGSVDWYRNYSAVTGACMLVRRDAYKKVDGFDEAFELIFGDVDLCLRVKEKGYRIVYDPDVVLIHYEGKTRGRLNPETDIKLGYTRFTKYIENGDPYYPPGLSRAYRLPVNRKQWEENPVERIKNIIEYEWY